MCLCRLLQIVDFRPLFIAPALRRLDTVLNVDKQGHASFLALELWRLWYVLPSIRSLMASSV